MGNSTDLGAVVAISSCDVLAVGSYHNLANQTLIEQWNGTKWVIQPSPNPGGPTNDNFLASVTATSATNAWASGDYSTGPSGALPLVEHWNGKKWSVQKTPNPTGSVVTYLTGVAATSPTNAWAVGQYTSGTAIKTLVEHWNGKKWAVQPSPNPGGKIDQLVSVAATSAKNAWAVGETMQGTTYQTLIEHWNGHTWSVQKSPDPGGAGHFNSLNSVAATSAKNAWAVGLYSNGGANRTLIEHWNGHSWSVQKSGNPGGPTRTNVLNGVAAANAGSAWAVGSYNNGTTNQTLIERWNGKAWKVEKSSNPGGTANDNQLGGAAATSPTTAWVVGFYNQGSGNRALALFVH